MRYYSFNQYLRERFGEKVRRISLNPGFPCPDRDGARCIYCNEFAFSANAGSALQLKEQIDRAIESERRNSGARKFMAYFQNGTGTNAPVAELKEAYDAVRGYPEIVALSVSTRPDCVDESKLDLIGEYRTRFEVWIELGLQTVHEKSLRMIRRGHTHRQTVQAVRAADSRGIKVGVHVILGLPGETREEMVLTARSVSDLPVSGVKMHVLHALKDTDLERTYLAGGVELMNRENYVRAACDFLENLRPDIVMLRLVSDARKEFLVAPAWINDKLSVMNDIEKELEDRGTRQGSSWRP